MCLFLFGWILCFLVGYFSVPLLFGWIFLQLLISCCSRSRGVNRCQNENLALAALAMSTTATMQQNSIILKKQQESQEKQATDRGYRTFQLRCYGNTHVYPSRLAKYGMTSEEWRMINAQLLDLQKDYYKWTCCCGCINVLDILFLLNVVAVLGALFFFFCWMASDQHRYRGYTYHYDYYNNYHSDDSFLFGGCCFMCSAIFVYISLFIGKVSTHNAKVDDRGRDLAANFEIQFVDRGFEFFFRAAKDNLARIFFIHVPNVPWKRQGERVIVNVNTEHYHSSKRAQVRVQKQSAPWPAPSESEYESSESEDVEGNVKATSKSANRDDYEKYGRSAEKQDKNQEKGDVSLSPKLAKVRVRAMPQKVESEYESSKSEAVRENVKAKPPKSTDRDCYEKDGKRSASKQGKRRKESEEVSSSWEVAKRHKSERAKKEREIEDQDPTGQKERSRKRSKRND
eukprot:gb/GEZN01006078.1/.p1 GENE.gb/GEZN01006078.1/~~gb/GEZN01006078.1/.p1  ORF type:complete len:456 (-),score=28.69 gb/GEZN01006078.1/:247-1614(-)